MHIATETTAVRVHFVDPTADNKARQVRVSRDEGDPDYVFMCRANDDETPRPEQCAILRFSVSEAKAIAAALLLLEV